MAIESGNSEEPSQNLLQIEQGAQSIEHEDGANDIFKHTFVDILDESKKKKENETKNEKPKEIEMPVKE